MLPPAPPTKAAKAATVAAEWLLGVRRTPRAVAWGELALAGCAALAAAGLVVAALAATEGAMEGAVGGSRAPRPWWSLWAIVKEWSLEVIAENDRQVCAREEKGPRSP